MKNPRKVSNIVLIVAISAVIGYTAAQILALCVAEIVFPDILTSCWYGFWTGELITLATIKNTKTKHQKPDDLEDDIDDTDEPIDED